jgi:hypothetical protein
LRFRPPIRFFRLGENPQLAHMSCLIYTRKNLLGALLLGAATLGYAQTPRPADATTREYAATITAEELSKHLRIIAADSMQGRDTGSEGQKMAADYIASQFFDANVKPVIKFPDGVEGYYQEFELVGERRRLPRSKRVRSAAKVRGTSSRRGITTPCRHHAGSRVSPATASRVNATRTTPAWT